MAPIRVLLVDDEPDFTTITAMALENTGRYKVRQENDSTRALAAVKEFRPDVLFLDIMMPGLDGGDVASQLQAEHLDVPTVFLTALVSAGESPGGTLQRGGKLYLRKPVSLSEMERVIEGALGAHTR